MRNPLRGPAVPIRRPVLAVALVGLYVPPLAWVLQVMGS